MVYNINLIYCISNNFYKLISNIYIDLQKKIKWFLLNWEPNFPLNKILLNKKMIFYNLQTTTEYLRYISTTNCTDEKIIIIKNCLKMFELLYKINKVDLF
jgi:hypothetical protein